MPADLRIVASIFLDQARAVWPYYLGGALFAAFIKTFKWDRRVRASLTRFGKAAVPVAVLAGLISPLCACGILPVVVALSAGGVPLPPVMALLVTSPLMSPDAFAVTAGQLGWTYALWKAGTAAVVGLSAGFLAAALVRRGVLSGSSFRAEKMWSENGKARPEFEDIVNAGCFSHAGEGGAVVDRPNRFLFFLDRFREMLWLVGKYLFAALLVQAVLTYYIPVNAIEPVLGRKSALSVLFATLLAVPLPLPQVAAPAFVKSLLTAGMSPGAGMALLIGGPVISAPALSVLAALYDRKAFALYVTIGFTAAFTAGMLFQWANG